MHLRSRAGFRWQAGLLLGLLAGWLGAGCTGFNRAWKDAALRPVPPDSIEGRWVGRWHSDKNQHQGPLRCILTRETNGLHRARFHAKYRRVITLSFGYTAWLEVSRQDGLHHFEGEADLGWYAGGVYRYRGHASATNFFSTYSSKHDHGTFQMTRPAEPD